MKNNELKIEIAKRYSVSGADIAAEIAELNINRSGNKKLVNNDRVRWLIWNIPAIITCPFATDMCKKFCYARKAEKAYPACLPSREKNLAACNSEYFAESMIYTIEKTIAGRAYAGKKVIFRIHESGDFFSPEYAAAWIKIANHFNRTEKPVYFWAYTKSIPYFRDLEIPANMVIRASIWADTDPALAAESVALYPIYTAYSESEIAERKANKASRFHECRCSDCGTCQACGNKNISDIGVKIH